MCRLQHSLGIVWRPQTPPLTAPTSNQSEQPCRQGPGATRPSAMPDGAEGAKAQPGPAGPREALRGATGSGCSGGLGQEGTGPRREAGPAPVFLGPGGRATGARGPARAPAEPHRLLRRSLALLPGWEGQGCACLGYSPGALRPRAWPSSPRPAPASESKSETARTQRSASAGPAGSPRRLVPSSARPPGCPLRRDLCGRRQAPRPWGSDTEGASVLLGRCECVLKTSQKSSREEGDWTSTNSGPVAASRACSLSLTLEGARRAGRGGIVLIWASLCRRL